MLGRGAEADRAFEQCFALSPERRLMALAAEHHKEGRLEDAEQLYRRVLRDHPGNVDAMRLLATLRFQAGRYEEAERLLERAIALAPDFLAAIIDLGRLRKEQDRYEEAIECFDRALELEPDNAQAHFLRGSTLAPAALTHEATDAYRRCLELRPGHAGALLGLGHVLKAVGRAEEAIAAYRECIRAKPDNGETWWSLANLKTYRFSDAEMAEMQSRLDGGGLNAAVRGQFPVRARQGLGGPPRFRAGLGLLPVGQCEAALAGQLRPGADRGAERPADPGVLPRFPRRPTPAPGSPIPPRSSSSACPAPVRRCSSRSSPATARSRAPANCRTSAGSRPG